MTLKREINKLKKLHAELESMKGAGDAYWELFYKFQDALGALLKIDAGWEKLPGRQWLQVLAWCSTYRPREPWQMLLTFSMYRDELLTRDAEAVR